MENDDGCYPQGAPIEEAATEFRVAIADGATESSYSGPFARALVQRFRLGHLTPRRWAHGLAVVRRRWLRQVESKQLPWYAQEKVQAGAFAALLGAEFTEMEPGRGEGEWKATAVGDCCIAQTRDDALVAMFPIDSATGFTSRPYLLSSREDRNQDLSDHIERYKGTWRTNDSFFLMTDALAAWFAACAEQGSAPWRALQDIDTEGPANAFPAFVEGLRAAGVIRNDDVTLVRVDILGP